MQIGAQLNSRKCVETICTVHPQVVKHFTKKLLEKTFYSTSCCQTVMLMLTCVYPQWPLCSVCSVFIAETSHFWDKNREFAPYLSYLLLIWFFFLLSSFLCFEQQWDYCAVYQKRLNSCLNRDSKCDFPNTTSQVFWRVMKDAAPFLCRSSHPFVLLLLDCCLLT